MPSLMQIEAGPRRRKMKMGQPAECLSPKTPNDAYIKCSPAMPGTRWLVGER